ncbi:MAG: SDR family oxidoreductase [Myxococcota bacterium]
MSGDEESFKVAIVTGASSGIGEATAKSLASEGYKVVLAARREALLDQVAGTIRDAGGTSLTVPTDLSDEAQTSALVHATLDAFGRVDVLVNNAGYGPPFALEQMNRDQLRHVFEVNLLSGMQLIAELTPVMRDQGGGRIINIGSLFRYMGVPLAASYAATKGGLDALTQSMRLELSPWNIQFSIIIPGFVDTPTFETARAAAAHLRDDPENPYRQLMSDLDAFAEQQLESAITPDEVATAIVKAAKAANPKSRYFVPAGTKNAVRIFGMMPEKLAERILLKMYKWGPWRG